MVGFSQGLNLSNLEQTTQEEIDAHLTTRWKGRGPLYDMYATSLMLDYAPDFAKLHRWGSSVTCPNPFSSVSSTTHDL